jgi:hypothetical protein
MADLVNGLSGLSDMYITKSRWPRHQIRFLLRQCLLLDKGKPQLMFVAGPRKHKMSIDRTNVLCEIDNCNLLKTMMISRVFCIVMVDSTL